MSKQKISKLDPFAERLEEWLTPADKGGGGKTLAQGAEQLRLAGCSVSLSRLSVWWESRQQEKMRESLLGQIATGARQCREMEKQFGSNPPPELAALIKTFQVLVLKLATEGVLNPEMLALASSLMRPVMEFAKLDVAKSKLDLDSRRVALLEKKAAQADATEKVLTDAQLSPSDREQRIKEIYGRA